MKSLLCGLLTTVLALLLLAAAAGGADGAARRTAPDSAINNDSAEIGVMTQEYIGDNIAEILMINYDGSQPALARFGGRNPEIESLNNAIKFGIQQRYNEFRESNRAGRSIEIKSYPFTSEDYLQIVMTSASYPSYGTDGSIWSYNFNKKDNEFMALADVLAELGLNERTLAQRVKNMYVPEDSALTVGEVKATGFLISRGSSGPVTQLLLEVVLENSGAEPWKYFFSYTPALNELSRLNSKCLFDPYDMDQMEPPLSYQREAAGGPRGEVPGDLQLTFDTRGLEVVVPGREYSLDGMVYFSLEKMAPAGHDRESVLSRIISREDPDLRLITLTPSEEHSALLSYPAWLVVYDQGTNEDARHCVDVYVHTGAADFRLHTSVPADFETGYHDEIGRRLATVAFKG
ncbi:MAG TPA: hypothetical protein VN462_08825 [Negativicutes bacterium]|nr:hypothetical protein [Negativicutes bacterium]